MSVIKNFLAIVVLLPLALIVDPAYAEYSYQMVSFPGADFTNSTGINNAGKVVGSANDGSTTFSFIYNMENGEYTNIGSELFAMEISNPGVMVGSVGDRVCAIRDKKGNITTFFPP